jgi:hypothetical protein
MHNNQVGQVSPGFKQLVANLVHQREQVQQIPAVKSPKGELMARTEDGRVMPFRVWAKRWSDENIDGRRFN